MPSASGPVAVASAPAPVKSAPSLAVGISPDLYPTEDDLPYEEEILREPFKLKGWWRYLVARATAPFAKRAVIYERALKALPGSYKLWHAYLRDRLDHARPHPIDHPAYSSLNNTFERALATMHKMPRVWVLYLTSLLDQRLLTRARRAFDRALRALPVTPELLSSVLLRQNPHNVEEWHRRVKLFEKDPARQVATYVEAVKTVDPMKAVGKPHTLWVAFAKMYEKHSRLDSAEDIFKRATQVNYKAVDHLASIWCEWAEMELRHNNFDKAIELMRQATSEPSVEVKRRAAAEGDEPVQMKVHKSLKLWSFYVDLEESLGTLDSTRAVYERILDLRIATPQIILNYAYLLEEHKYFEDAFKVYERGVKIFKYPHVKAIWVTYLTKFVHRYKRSKLERARELFHEAVQQAPAEEKKPLYLQWAKLEEDYGLAKRAMNVYDEAVRAVPNSEKMAMYEIYIARAAELFGVPRTRQIYEQAIESGLPDRDVLTMCMKFAELERSLGEIDRSRAIYVHASNYADPNNPDFWKKWNDFEIQHGNEDTFREMLRIKRTVAASRSQTHFILPEYLMQRDQKLNLDEAVDTLKRAGVPEDEMAALERQLATGPSTAPPAAPSTAPASANRMMNFVSAGVEAQVESSRQQAANNEDIELPDESDDEEPDVQIAEKSVPAAVFGELGKRAAENNEESSGAQGNEQLGALERIKRRRQ
ncbi:Tetratricopeptide repeat (TPR)-like superfamily protein [Zea mays]|uniref:Pre-mRNA-splicing factor SYF1 n=1 Tax=Zea mays TaxID=4577 RepID=A0A1D6IL62_MAIZE|nr:Tetratricopeptide repeat (TPR)-like superfamily protein [Zea mays]